MSGNKSYRALLTTPGVRPWLFLLICQRFSVAMTPLSLIYLGNALTGSLAFGSVMAGLAALLEAVFAIPLGRRFDRHPLRRELGFALAVQAILVGAGAIFAGTAPPPAVAAMVLVGVGLAAGAHGGLRTLVLHLAPQQTHQALSLESALSTAVWAAAPALVALLTVTAGPTAATAAIALFSLLGCVGVALQREPDRVDAQRSIVARTEWIRLLPSCMQAAAVMLAVGGLTVCLVGLLPRLNRRADSAGLWLAAMAVSGVLGALFYGSRRWPGRPATQSTFLLVGLGVVVATLAVVGEPMIAFVLITVVGIFEATANVSRSLALQQVMPPHSHGAAFSALYASAGVGYGTAGVLAAPILDAFGPRQAILVCAATATAITLLSATLDWRRASHLVGTQDPVALPPR